MAKVLKGDFSRSRVSQQKNVRDENKVPDYQLKLSLAFSDPLIWRRVQVPGRMTLAQMHRVIQVCMGWDDTDPHQFLVGKIFYQPGFGIENFKRTPQYDEASFTLHQLEEAMQFVFTYLYDGGEGWEIEITLEDILAPDTIPAALLLAGECACPPEEVGDIHQYLRLLAAFEQEAADLTEISIDIGDGVMFDPSAFDRDLINEQLNKL